MEVLFNNVGHGLFGAVAQIFDTNAFGLLNDARPAWDARRRDEQDDEFKMAADVARRFCGSVRRHYAVFNELTTMNA